jgi:hypothetical protein
MLLHEIHKLPDGVSHNDIPIIYDMVMAIFNKGEQIYYWNDVFHELRRVSRVDIEMENEDPEDLYFTIQYAKKKEDPNETNSLSFDKKIWDKFEIDKVDGKWVLHWDTASTYEGDSIEDVMAKNK